MLVTLLEEEAVPFETLHERYGSLLELVRTLIGVVPNCDPYLEIWPPAFRTYNVMVPGFLNLPLSIWGLGAPPELLGLGMYVSSRVAECAYCSAHTCSFALRRGANPSKIEKAVDEHDPRFSAKDRATISVARSLARVPTDITDEQRRTLRDELGETNAEWIVLGIGMMGFLNKFMDAVGVELEPETIAEVDGVIAPSGWKPGKHFADAVERTSPPRADGVLDKLGVLRLAPSAVSLDRKWTAGVPNCWPEVGDFLLRTTRHRWPVLSRLRHPSAIRALATMLRDNLDPRTSVIGIPKKLAAGAIYAEVAADESLAKQVEQLGTAERDEAVTALAKAIAPSPAIVDGAVVDACRTLKPKEIVEVVTFVSLLQLVHRLEAYFPG